MSEENFARYKSRQVLTWTLINASRMHEMPYALSTSKPLAGEAVVVVGAGPSLEKNGHELVEAQTLGLPIIGVNASDRPMRDLGVTPDVIVARESIDLADQVADSTARMWVLDVSVFPHTWDAVRDGPMDGLWFLPTYSRHAILARRLGLRPLYGGTSALCSAISLALQWGAETIILAGVDLALTNGRPYHPGAPRGDETVTLSDDLMHFDNTEQDHERCERSGQQPQSSGVGYEMAMAYDWSGTLPALHTWKNQRDWIATAAHRRQDSHTFVNATGGGSGIPYWRTAPLREAIQEARHGLPVDRSPVALPAGYAVPEEHTRVTRGDLRKEAGVLGTIAREMLSPNGPDLKALGSMTGLLEGSELTEALAAWQIIDCPKDPGVERAREVYRCMKEAAEEAGRALRRHPPSV